MIESFDVPKNAVAKWAGITSAVFSLSQAATGVVWGQASDRFGRKPVILCAMLCIMCSSLLFGFSRSLVWAIITRSLTGASNGNVGIMRTAVAEMVPYRELQPMAFSVMPLVWTIGSIFGPGFGGALANPATKYPRVFESQFWKAYPFALPNFVAGGFFLVGLVVGTLFLKETLDTKKDRQDFGRVLGHLLLHPFKRRKPSPGWRHEEERSSLLKHSPKHSVSSARNGIDAYKDHEATPVAAPSYREVFSYQSNLNLLVYTLLALHSIAYDQLLPVFMHYPPQKDRSSDTNVTLPFRFSGGFGIGSDRIGILFTAYGIVGMFIQFFAFPPLASRFGVLTCLKVVTAMFPVIYLATPFTALFPTALGQQIAMFAVMLFKCWASIFAFPCTTILLTNSAVSLRILGTLNGVSTSISAVGKAVGPALTGWAFSIGVDRGYAILPWWTLAVFAVLGAIAPWWLVEMEGFRSEVNIDDNDENSLLEESQAPNERTQPVNIGKDSLGGSPDEGIDSDAEHAAKPAGPASETSPVGLPLRRMSSPIGQRENVGPGGTDRLCNGLGQTRSGLGAGGTSYH
ncbi:hypothetical protein MMC21_000660 [Puttea exsequens]|nr:hypothetical protein [Puttea exsequens]